MCCRTQTKNHPIQQRHQTHLVFATLQLDCEPLENLYYEATSHATPLPIRWVIVRVAMRPVDDASVGDTLNLEGWADTGSGEQKINTTEFTIKEEPDQIEKEEKPTMKLAKEEAYPIKIRERIWIPFSITIPLDSLLKVDVEVKAPIKDDRAILTVHDIRIKSGGINIPCSDLYPKPAVTRISTTPTTQTDVVKAFVGYFTNLGLTHKMNKFEEGDDDITIEVQVEMSDHPATDHKEQFEVTIISVVGETTLELKQLVEVDRDGKEKANFDINVKIDNMKTYVRGEKITVTLTLRHVSDSKVEPLVVIVRFYLPPFVEFDEEVSDNATVVSDVQFNPEYGGLDVELEQFLFSDSATVTFNLLADPNFKRDYGEGEIDSTTPYRVLCLMTTRNTPTQNPDKPDKILSCGPIDHLSFTINTAECYNALGLDQMDTCQLSASSAANKDMGPDKVGKGKGKGWSPALRSGLPKPVLNIDFQRMTRITMVEFYKVDGARSVTKYRLQLSFTGFEWLYANDVTELKYDENGVAADKVETPFLTRYAKVIVEETEKDDEDEKYLGVEMEVFGCYVTEKHASVSCTKTDPTWYSDNKNQYGRHFSVDTENDIIYFCDLEYDMKNLICFSSPDDGSSWKILPRSIGGILGYDKDSAMTYAYDKLKRSYMASDNGINWVLKDEKEVNDTAEKDTFTPCQHVPAYTSGDIANLDAKQGKWEPSFEGLVQEGSPDPKARWSRCCKTK